MDCTGCGVCSVRCPSGVFEIKGFAVSKFIDNVKALLKDRERAISNGVVLKIGCYKVLPDSKGLSGNILCLRIPCLGLVSPSLILGLICAGVEKTVFVDAGLCNLCESKKGAEALFGVVELLGSISKSLKQMGKISIEKFPIERERLMFEADRLKGHKGTEEMDRRAFFSFIKRKSREKAQDLLPDKSKGKDRASKKRKLPHIVPTERVSLINYLSSLSLRRSNEILSPLFVDISIDKGCNGCQLCTLLCPTGALFKTEDREAERIGFAARNCTVCGLCKEVCPLEALRFNYTVSLDMILDNTDNILIEFKKVLCEGCGTAFIKRDGNEDCEICRKQSVPFLW